MHASEREKAIIELIEERGFIALRDLAQQIDASSATLRRDLERLDSEGQLLRVRGGAKRRVENNENANPTQHLSGVPFHENVHLHPKQKAAIGRAAAGLCESGTAIMIDGGSTTLQMCRHLDGLDLQVLTNSLYIVSALLPQTDTRILVTGGAIFREQNIILATAGDDLMPRFYAPKLFIGAAAIGKHGVMQADVVLVAAERRLIERADEVILLVDSSKFRGSSGNVVCSLQEIDIVVTDKGIDAWHRAILESAGIRIIIADADL
jgi:DeoR family ulaG and ulaABCDEF operon transcriptional repressor